MAPGFRPSNTTATKACQSQPEAMLTQLHTPPKSADTVSLAELATVELEQLHAQSNDTTTLQSFPAACRALLLEMDGNARCLDCGVQSPEWAAVSYGALVCLQCAGHHRSLGVHVSTVRSITMDHWKYSEVVKMLEGGNRQLAAFFQRHALDKNNGGEFQSPKLSRENISSMRYKTKAALFYRQHLEHHVEGILVRGPYTTGRRRHRKRRPLGMQTSSLE